MCLFFINALKYQYLSVDGGWGEWTEWAECSVTCGGGEHGRTRVCDSPAPEYGGSDCTADGSSDSETEACGVDPCPSM